VTIEVLYFDGCPNHEALLPRLHKILAGAGIRDEIDLRRITDDESAQRERFLGSPTVRVNGRDIEPDAERRTDYGMKCRLYRTPAGISGQPHEEWLRAALHLTAGADTELETVLSDSPINGQSFAARAGKLTPAERSLYRYLLTNLIEGNSPALDALPDEAAGLIEADLIQTDDNDCVIVAYPFSAQPTRHRVILRDGRSFQAMCAIDALGIPYMLNERGKVQAHEPDGQEVVRVTIDPAGEPTWTPAHAVAVAAFGDGCCLAQSACPHINLFASPEAATRYLDAHALQGSILSIPDAAAAGRWLFGDLLHSLTDTKDR
jgi:hypothetical protein